MVLTEVPKEEIFARCLDCGKRFVYGEEEFHSKEEGHIRFVLDI